MRWPIRNQIFVPFAAVLLAAVALIAVTMAVLEARRRTGEQVDQLHRVVATLADASFPFTENVLLKMRGLSGAEFVALDAGGGVLTSTLGRALVRKELPARLPASGPPSRRLEEYDAVEVAGVRYFGAVIAGSGNSGASSLLVLYPEQNLSQARWEAAWPPLAIGAATVLVMLAISAWASQRFARRIEAVRVLFERIADGEFSRVAAQPPNDEVYDLVQSANRLSEQLASMRDQVGRTERLRLLAQLAGGLAHQLRNAITGARMAVQLHQRRCPIRGTDESLAVALRQLTLTEEHVRALLSAGNPQAQAPSPGRLGNVLAEIERLVLPAAQHARVDWTCEASGDDVDLTLANAASVRAGLLNVALNAIEAAGGGGRVRLWTERSQAAVRIHIADSGPGPPGELCDTLFDPFVSSKPEGIGLGLALARSAAAEHSGALSWSRVDGQTVFTMSLGTAADGEPGTHASVADGVEAAGALAARTS